MKITKILSAVAAAAVATAAVSATAGATLTIPTGINTRSVCDNRHVDGSSLQLP